MTYTYYFKGKVMIDADTQDEADEVFDECTEYLEVEVLDIDVD